MTTPVFIPDHANQAVLRLLYQFRDATKLQGLMNSFNAQIQDLENMFIDLLQDRWIDTAVGLNLDRWGVVLDEPRFGLGDDDYRVQLVAKVAQNTSEATAEDLISMFKILTRAEYVWYSELYPAEVTMVAVDANPIGDTARIREVLNRAKPAGVEITAAAVAENNAFAFDGDVDPDSGGFDDALSPGQPTAGFWSVII